MPARSFGYAEVEERLQEIRRRLNLLVVQQALYAAASAGFLVAAALVVVALLAGNATFRLSLWLAVPTLVATLVLAGRFVAQRLVSVEETARFADRKAGLQDRLATLHAHGRTRTPSRLADVLLAEAMNFSPRWKVSALGVRRFPRSIYLAVLSLGLLGATAFLEPQTEENTEAAARPQAPKPSESEKKPQKEAMQRVLLRSSASGETTDTAGDGGSGSGDAGHPGAGGRMKDHPALAPSRGRGQMAGAGADQQGEADAASQLQDLIRNALANSDAKEDRSGDDLRLARGKPAGGRQSRPDGRTDATDTPSESKRSAADHKEEGAEKGRAREGSQAGAAAEGSKSAREGAKGPSGALYGTGDPVPSEPANSQKFALRLMGSSAARMQIEPQGKGEPAISAEGVGVGAEASLPEIGEQEVPDSALHRAEISPEHEAILGRIFLRD